MSTHDDVQSSRREQRNQPSRLIRSRRLRWLGGRSRASEQAERTGQESQVGQASQVGQMGQVDQVDQPSQAGQAGTVGLGGAKPQAGGSIPGIQPLEMAAADFGNLRAQHSATRQRGAAMAGQREGVGWLYARIYCAGGDDTDALLPEVAQWLERARGQWDIRSAHFLRFVDLRGHHIRLRLKAVEGVLDEAYASMRELGAVAQRTEARTAQELSAHEDAALRCLSNGDREGARVQMRQWANLSADYDSARAEQAKAIRSIAELSRATVPSISANLSRPNSPIRKVLNVAGSSHCSGTPAAV